VLLAPLLIWAGYFLLVYVVTAIACARYPAAPIAPVLWSASVAAIGLNALTGWAFYRRLYRAKAPAPDRRLTLQTGLLLSLVALIAITWTALPVLFIHPCE
jgi:hypothetical protein